MAETCGEDPSRPAYSDKEYAAAFKAAHKVLKDKTISRERRKAIEQNVARLKECQSEESFKFVKPPLTDCANLIPSYRAFQDRLGAIASGKLTPAQEARVVRTMDRLKESFREDTQKCLKNLYGKCLDLTKPSEIDKAVELINIASAQFSLVFTFSTETGIDRFLSSTTPFNLRIKPCAATNWACDATTPAGKAACANRIKNVKSILESYID